MDFSLTDILLVIIAIAISIIAIKITFSFNLNEYLKSRDEKLQQKIKNYCTHANVENTGSQISIQSSFISPHGTTSWICQKCSLHIYHLDEECEKNRIEFFIKNPKEFRKQEKKFQKLVKRAGFL